MAVAHVAPVHELEADAPSDDPGARRRYRFKHPTASGKTIAAAGFVDAARTTGVLILTHRRLLVDQFTRDLTKEGYGPRLHEAVLVGDRTPDTPPLTINTYSWFIKHASQLKAEVYGVVVCDEAHTALGEKTSAAIRSLSEPVYIGMTATDQLLQKHVSDVFPAEVADLPLAEAVRRGVVAPLRCVRVRPIASLRTVEIVGGDFDQGQLAVALDLDPLNMAAADLYQSRLRRHAGHRLRSRRRPRRARGRGHEGDRAAGRRRLRPHPAPRACRDAGRLRARRDQRAGERDAAGRGMERPSGHGLHAPRADRQPPRLPAAGRPHHAPPPPQGVGHRGRLRRARRTAHRARDHAALAARRRCLPAQRAGHAAAAAPPPLAPPAAEADRQGSLLDRPRLGRPGAPDRGDRQPVAPGGCVQAADRRAARLGGRRRPRRHAGRRAAAGRADRGAAARIAGAVPVHVRGREQAPQAAPGGARRPVLPAAQPDHLRHGLPAGRGRAHLAAGPRPGRARAAAGHGRRQDRCPDRPDRGLDVAAGPGRPRPRVPLRGRPCHRRPQPAGRAGGGLRRQDQHRGGRAAGPVATTSPLEAGAAILAVASPRRNSAAERLVERARVALSEDPHRLAAALGSNIPAPQPKAKQAKRAKARRSPTRARPSRSTAPSSAPRRRPCR